MHGLPYYTAAERLAPYSHQAHGFLFTCAALDLSAPIVVTSRWYVGPPYAPEQVAAAVADFITYWVLNIRPRLNGHRGTGELQWVFAETPPPAAEAQAVEAQAA